jgi:hypothetical protein
LFRGFWRGHERRRDDILNLCLIQFLKRKRGGEGIYNYFCFPQIGGFWRGGKRRETKI